MEFLKKIYNKEILYFILVTLAVSPAFATSEIDNRNFLLIGSMGLGFIFLIFSHPYRPRIDYKLILLIFLMFGFQLLFHRGSFRPSSIFFTCMFFFYFMLTIRVFFKGNPSAEEFLRIIRLLIYAYFIVLLIQQFCVATGLPVFNGSHITMKEPWKLNSLSAEPSHTSRFVGILMYAYLSIEDKIAGYKLSFFESFKQSKKVWIAFLWVILTTVSGTGMLVVILIMARYFSTKILWVGVLMLGTILGIAAKSDITALSRFASFSQAVITLSPEAIIEADHSASVRVVPMILCISKIDPLSIDGWIGKGMGNVSSWLSQEMPGLPDGFSGGAMAAFALEFGLIIALFYFILSFKLCYDKDYKISSIGLWVSCCVLIGINSQIGWCCLTFLFLSKQYKTKKCVQKSSTISRKKPAMGVRLAPKYAR